MNRNRVVQLLDLFHGNSLRTQLIRATGGTFVLQITALGLRFLTSIMLARLLGVFQYGAYNYALSWLTVLAMPTLLGLDRLLIREFAIYHKREAWGLMQGLLRFANGISLLISAGLVLIVGGVSIAIVVSSATAVTLPFLVPAEILPNVETDLTPLVTLWIALLMLPLNSLTLARGSAMRGLKQIILSQIPDQLVRPLLFIALFGITYMLLGGAINAPWAMLMRVITALVVLVYGTFVLIRALPEPMRRARPVYQVQEWLGSSMPMFGVGLMNVLNARLDVLMLGVLGSITEVGLYTTALLLANTSSILLTASTTSLGPTYAQIYDSGDMARLQRVVLKSTRATLLASLPVVVLILVFGEFLLSIFGPEFQAAYPALVILVVGQFVNTAAGTVGILMMMSGYERVTLVSRIVGVIVYAILNLILIPGYGMNGAALATTISLSARNVILVTYAWQHLRIHTSILGLVALWWNNRR